MQIPWGHFCRPAYSPEDDPCASSNTPSECELDISNQLHLIKVLNLVLPCFSISKVLIPSLFFSFIFLQVQKFTNLDYFQYLVIISKTKMCVEVQNLLVCRVPFLDTTHIGCKQTTWDFSFIMYPHFIILHSIMVQSPFPFTLASLLFPWYCPPPAALWSTWRPEWRD